MSIPTFRPSKEADLLTWSANWNQKINADSTLYGLTDPQANAYDVLHVAFEAAYAAVHNPNTNTKQATIAKNQAKEALLYGPNRSDGREHPHRRRPRRGGVVRICQLGSRQHRAMTHSARCLRFGGRADRFV